MKRWFLWNFTMLNTHAEILWISSILEYLELEINILFQWAFVSSTIGFLKVNISDQWENDLKYLGQRVQNTIFSFAKYTRPWLLGNQIKSNSCDFNWGERDLDKYQEKFYDCAGEIMNFTFQQQLLDEISMKQIHWLSSFQRTFEAQLDPPIGYEWQRRLYIHFRQVQKLFTCFIAFWVSNGSEVIYHCLQSYIQVKMDGVIVYPKPEKRKGWHSMH